MPLSFSSCGQSIRNQLGLSSSSLITARNLRIVKDIRNSLKQSTLSDHPPNALILDRQLAAAIVSSLEKNIVPLEPTRRLHSSIFPRATFASAGSFELDKRVGPLVLRHLNSACFNRGYFDSFEKFYRNIELKS